MEILRFPPPPPLRPEYVTTRLCLREANQICLKLCLQMEQLYIEVLYTIKYKVGSSGSPTSHYQEELYAYAQKAFKVSNDMHRRYLSIASEEKVSKRSREMSSFYFVYQLFNYMK